MATKIWRGGNATNPTSWAEDDLGGGGDSNWVTAAGAATTKPASADDVVIAPHPGGTQYDIDAGLAQSALALATLNVLDSYTGEIGSKETKTALAVGMAAGGNVRIGVRAGTSLGGGPSWCDLDLGSTNAAEVHAIAGGNICLEHSHASAVLYVYDRAVVGLGTARPSAVWNIPAIRKTGGSLVLGNGGSTVTLLVSAAGLTVIDDVAITTLQVLAGEAVVLGGSAAGTVEVGSAGVVRWLTDGTLTTLRIYGGTFDAAGDARDKTITTALGYGLGSISLRNGRPGSITMTNGIDVFDPNFSVEVDAESTITVTSA